MFRFLKRFFSKPAAPEPPPIATAPPQPARSPVPARPAPAQSVSPPPAPGQSSAAGLKGAPASPPGGSGGVTDPDGVLDLPLAPILASLPPDLAALAASPSGGAFSLPVRTALAQLATGAVRIPFGELRRGSPSGTFYDNATLDASPVRLPLPDILTRMDPALLARRPGQKQVAVPESVTPVFGLGRTLEAPVAAAPQSLEREFVAAPLSALSESWPPAVLETIAQFQVAEARRYPCR